MILIFKYLIYFLYTKKYPVRDSNPHTYLYNRYALSIKLIGHKNYITLLLYCQFFNHLLLLKEINATYSLKILKLAFNV